MVASAHANVAPMSHDATDPVPPYGADFARRVNDAVILANTLSEDLLGSKPFEALLNEIVESHGAQPIIGHFDRKYVQTREIHGPNDKTVLKPLQLEVRVPCEGAIAVLFQVPNRILSSTHSQGNQSEIILSATISPDGDWGAKELNERITAWTDRFAANIRDANEIITQHRADLTDAVRPILEARWRRTRLLRGALKELSIPLERTSTPASSIPLEPKSFSLARIEDEAQKGAPEWSLADDMAEGIITTIAGFSSALERLPLTADRLIGEDEETLRDVLLFILNANYGGLVTGETFIGKGKADLLLRWKDRDAFVGECKIWKGPAAFSQAIDQLLDRYTLWRHSRVALIVFIRDTANTTSHIESAHETLLKHSRTQLAHPSPEPMRRRDYTVAASADERRPATLSLLPVVLPRPSL